MLRALDKLEDVVRHTPLFILARVVMLATFGLGWLIVREALTPTMFLLEIDEMREPFGQFLVVLIGLELIHSVQVYIEQREYHLEAISRWR